jgi:GNAT superfamily N-acetyltransferase
MIYVTEYSSVYSDLVEKFRLKTFAEGNQSLSYEKYDPEAADGKTWLTFIDDELASISAVEASRYTGDPDVAARVCRYHILKKFRHSHCGFRMLEQQIPWARDNGFKILYWTHDIKNKALNAMYQHRRKMTDAAASEWFEKDWYKEVKLDTRWLFHVSPKSDMLQYVYYVDLQREGYNWVPSRSVIWHEHDGQLSDFSSSFLNSVTPSPTLP